LSGSKILSRLPINLRSKHAVSSSRVSKGLLLTIARPSKNHATPVLELHWLLPSCFSKIELSTSLLCPLPTANFGDNRITPSGCSPSENLDIMCNYLPFTRDIYKIPAPMRQTGASECASLLYFPRNCLFVYGWSLPYIDVKGDKKPPTTTFPM